MKNTAEKIDEEINSIANDIIREIETASSKEISDVKYVKKILQLSDLQQTKKLFTEIEQAKPDPICVTEKKAVIKALLLSTWMQRLYFIIRSSLMGLLGAVITFLYIMILGSINVYHGIFLGIIVFLSTLYFTRLFDKQIIVLTKKIVRWLAAHKEIRDFIMDHF